MKSNVNWFLQIYTSIHFTFKGGLTDLLLPPYTELEYNIVSLCVGL